MLFFFFLVGYFYFELAILIILSFFVELAMTVCDQSAMQYCLCLQEEAVTR